MGEVDAVFIQAIEHRPKPTIIEAEGIPLIDLSLFNSTNQNDIAKLVSEIGDACENWGFFQVINHGVPLESRERIELASRKFFALCKDEKLKVERNEFNPLGYYDAELTKKVRDWKEVFQLQIENSGFIRQSHYKDLKISTNQWPAYPPQLREVSDEYAEEMVKLSSKILELISLSLNLKADRLLGLFKEQTNFIRLNHFPPCPEPHLALGLGRHKDGGALTIVAQDDIGGLEIKRKTKTDDGYEWVRVKPIPNAYIINLGDVIQVWSNDKYESVEHRVTVNSEKDRFSVPFFLNPGLDDWVEPLEELIDEQNPAKYRAYNWGEFLTSKLHCKLKGKGREAESVQTYHFKI